eukprot:TRINITY_DN2493_c0_g1_i4.p1 TRINITY_DN2493_c0_g1~~TRINITY_DN2493_c0_g1_i4.p1  ORF type:complete len:788 (+),score=133.60 TRINITY_DN2493_c0_g1_i4:152-2365(+)
MFRGGCARVRCAFSSVARPSYQTATHRWHVRASAGGGGGAGAGASAGVGVSAWRSLMIATRPSLASCFSASSARFPARFVTGPREGVLALWWQTRHSSTTAENVDVFKKRESVAKWSADEVARWASDAGLDKETIAKLKNNPMVGKALVAAKQHTLEKSYSSPNFASIIIEARDALFTASPAAWAHSLLNDTRTLRPEYAILASKDTLYEAADQISNEFAIINGPKVTLSNPPLDMDIEFALNEQVLVAAEADPDTRAKPICGTVRGSGAGKTRFLEELRALSLRSHPNVLPLVITYGNFTDVYIVEGNLWRGLTDVHDDMRGAVGIVARMLFALCPIDTSIMELSTRISLLPPPTWVPEEVVRAFVAEAASWYGRQVGRNIDTVVAMMDETMHLVNYYSPRFKDVPLLFTSAMLDCDVNALHCPVVTRLNCAVVMTALGRLDSIGSSQRTAYTLLLPNGLSGVSVASSWWKLPVGLPPDMVSALDLLATALSPVPRCIEYALPIVREATEGLDSRASLHSADGMKQLFSKVVKKIRDMYGPFPAIPPDVMYKLVFQEALKFDDTRAPLVATSVLTNQVDIGMVPYRLPSASIPMLVAALEASPKTARPPLRLMHGLLYDLAYQKVGDVLENFFSLWIRIRFAAAVDNGVTEMKVREFLGCDRLAGIVDLRNTWQLEIHTMQHSSTNEEEFIAELSNLDPRRLWLVKSKEGDRFDHALKHDGGTVFVELSSNRDVKR